MLTLKKNSHTLHFYILNFYFCTCIMAEPLAERMRPHTLEDYIGQKHLVGEGAVLRRMIDAGHITSFILWGPPGVGKTTLAQIIANKLKTPFYTLSAVTSGVKDVRDVIERARNGRFFNSASPILFIDEIHRFSKSQQDSRVIYNYEATANGNGTLRLPGDEVTNYHLRIIKGINYNAMTGAKTQYDLALMTCHGQSLGNGNATQRLVLFANKI